MYYIIKDQDECNNMGIIIDWLGCTVEGAVIEYSIGVVLFFGWFFSMWFLNSNYVRKEEKH